MDVTFIMMILDDALYAHDDVHLSFLGQEIFINVLQGGIIRYFILTPHRAISKCINYISKSC